MEGERDGEARSKKEKEQAALCLVIIFYCIILSHIANLYICVHFVF
jgi:hypothetical protein